jgi:hypothetical protein
MKLTKEECQLLEDWHEKNKRIKRYAKMKSFDEQPPTPSEALEHTGKPLIDVFACCYPFSYTKVYKAAQRHNEKFQDYPESPSYELLYTIARIMFPNELEPNKQAFHRDLMSYAWSYSKTST